MRVLSVELDDATVDALEAERELLGFESRSAYVRWLLAHRGSIDPGGDRAALLETYRERIAQLEAALEAADATDKEPVAEGVAPEAAPDRESSEAATDAEDAVHEGDRAAGEATDPDEWTRSRSDPSVEVRGSPRRTVVRTDGSSTADPTADDRSAGAADANADPTSETASAEGEANDGSRPAPGAEASGAAPVAEPGSGDGSVEERLEGAIESSNLTPERIERIREDPVAEDAGVLGSVEVDRLDELARRAVAKTRKRLDRDVQTGLEYKASTGLAADDVRPGEDVVDLEDLEVPGRSAEVCEARREAAGRAIAFLRDRGRARRSDFVDALYAAHPAGYDTVDGWWRCIKTALKQVDAVDGGEGARVWRFERRRRSATEHPSRER